VCACACAPACACACSCVHVLVRARVIVCICMQTYVCLLLPKPVLYSLRDFGLLTHMSVAHEADKSLIPDTKTFQSSNAKRQPASTCGSMHDASLDPLITQPATRNAAACRMLHLPPHHAASLKCSSMQTASLDPPSRNRPHRPASS